MAYHTTILRQIIDIFPRHECESLAKNYHVGQKFRSFNLWTKFMVMFIGQLSGRKSLHDLVMNLGAQTKKLYHLEIKPCSRATLARVKAKGITVDRTILLGIIPQPLRLIGYLDPETGKEYRIITNADHLDAMTIADIYKERWQIELFFKWIKENLKIKTFLGTSRNAVLTQIWIDLCVYLLLSFLKFKAKLGLSLQQMLRLLQLNLFERRNIIELFKPPDPQPLDCRQFLLFSKL